MSEHSQELRIVGGPYAALLAEPSNKPGLCRAYRNALEQADKQLEMCSQLEMQHRQMQIQQQQMKQMFDTQYSALQRQMQYFENQLTKTRKQLSQQGGGGRRLDTDTRGSVKRSR